MTCKVCEIDAVDAAKFASIQEALVVLPVTEVAAQHGFTEKTMGAHFRHSPIVHAARQEHLLAARGGTPALPRPAPQARGGRAKLPAKSIPVEPPIRAKGRHHTRAIHLEGVVLEQKAWDLRIKGKSYPMIADAMGLRLASGELDPKAAHRLVTRAMDRCGRVTQAAIVEHREIENARLDVLLEAFLPRAREARVTVSGPEGAQTYDVDTDQQDRAALVVLQIGRDRRKLLGLDVGSKRDSNASGALGGMGPHALPPPLALLDPPPTAAELEHYVQTGDVPRRQDPVGERSYLRDGTPRLPPGPPATPGHQVPPAQGRGGTMGETPKPPRGVAPAPPASSPVRKVVDMPPGPEPASEAPPLPPPSPLVDVGRAFPWKRKAR